LDAAQSALQVLEDDDSNALRLLNSALQQLQSQVHLESDFKDPVDVLASSLAQAEDAVHTLRGYLRRTELDPAAPGRAGRAHGAVGFAGTALQARTARFARVAGDMANRAGPAGRCVRSGWPASRRKARRRPRILPKQKSWAKRAPRRRRCWHKSITQAMQGLGMQGGQFQVQLETSAQAMQSGLEDVSFLVAGHAGSTPRPVGKVASGGELSRMALAIAVTTSQLGTAQTLIFDEVDSGVGGAVAETVGRLMRQLGADRQVLAVTHLPQVAPVPTITWSWPNSWHAANATQQRVDGAGEQRVAEIARMLGGEKLSSTTLAHAKEMLRPETEMTQDDTHTMEIVLITGMSGSGKSVALHALEDAGFYCVDNLPPELLLPFVELEQQHLAHRVAIAMDVRSATSLPLVPQQLDALRKRALPSNRFSWTPTPKPWCGATPRRGASTRCPKPTPALVSRTHAVPWWTPLNWSVSC
jgi:hypothetical protein